MDSWKDIISDEEIEYTESELLELRCKNKSEWRRHLNILLSSESFKLNQWNFEGSSDFSVAPFESHHKKEVLDMILYQFSSCGNNTFHKILNTSVGDLYHGCNDCLDHICLTGLGYVLLDKYNHVSGVFYGWDLRDEPIWKNEDKYHSSSKKEDEIITKANEEHPFANHIFECNKNGVEYGKVFFGEILCIKPHLMKNGWFTKLSFNICILFGMEYQVYYDYDFQPSRHLYKRTVFDTIPWVKDAILRYDLFYFGDFEFKDGTKMADYHHVLKEKYGYKDVDNLRRNAYLGCFILRNSKWLKQHFDNDFIKCNEAVQMIRKTQERLLYAIKIKKNKQYLRYYVFMLYICWNAIAYSIRTSKTIKLSLQIVLVALSAVLYFSYYNLWGTLL